MDEKTARSQRPIQPDRQSFSPRTHPDRPPDSGNRIDSRSERGDCRYSERCNPNRTRPPLDDDQQGLATRYLPLAHSLARRMKDSFPDAVDEFQSAAFLALVEAAQSFDSSRRVGFASFARHRIWGALCDLRREIIKRVQRGGGEAELVLMKLATGYETGGRLIGVEPDEPVGSELEALETLQNWIGQLPRLQAQAFRHIYLDGKTQKEAAALVGCSKSYLNRMHSEGLRSLQQTCRFQTARAPSEPED
ncbi:MAG: sigma-70 family RNA polymerase sigma factor [Isosphaeraceae bacterium]